MQYSIFRAPFLAFYSRKFYSDTALTGKGTGLLYLFIILLVLTPLSMASRYLHFASFLDDSVEINEMVTRVPGVTVKQGTLSLDRPSPYKMEYINTTTKEKSFIIFDTSGKSTSRDDAKALITEKGVFMDGIDGLVPWSAVPMDFAVSSTNFRDSIKNVVLGLTLIGAVLLPIVFWLGHTILALIYALVGLFMDRNKLGFGTALRMAIVAMTPAIVLSTVCKDILFCSPQFEPFVLLLSLATVPLTLGYLFFGYSSIAVAAPEKTVLTN